MSANRVVQTAVILPITILLATFTVIVGSQSIDRAADPAVAAAGSGASVAPGPEPVRPAQFPCNPKLGRSVAPRAVSADRGQIDIRANVDYQCATKAPPAYFLLLVESTNKIPTSGWSGQRMLKNIRDGLKAFVGNMDYANGTQGGMLTYNSNVTVHSEIEGGSAGQRSLQNAIDRFTPTSNASARAAGEAINRATQILTAANPPSDTLKLILILDAGAPFTGADVDVNQACSDARAAGVTMAVYALKDAGDRLGSCADRFRASSRGSGDDIPDALGGMATTLASGDLLDKLRLTDSLSTSFEYIKGSASPTEPEQFMNELGWDVIPPAPPGGHEISYSIRVREGAVPGVVRLSKDFSLGLYYKSGSFYEMRTANPEVCIFPPDDPAFCDDFIATLTPPAPTPTSAPTSTRTPTTEAATATVEASPTREVTQTPPTTAPGMSRIYLPVADKDFRVGEV